MKKKKMVYDKLCSKLNESTEFNGNLTDPTLVALLAVEGTIFRFKLHSLESSMYLWTIVYRL